MFTQMHGKKTEEVAAKFTRKAPKKQKVKVPELFDSIARQLDKDKDGINDADEFHGKGVKGNHGDNMAYNFGMLADSLRDMSDTDAAAQLRRAAELLEQKGRGGTAGLYAEGLREASQNPKLQGRDGIGIEDLLPFLQSMTGGIQRRSGAQPGQGTLLDSLLPAIAGLGGSTGGYGAQPTPPTQPQQGGLGLGDLGALAGLLGMGGGSQPSAGANYNNPDIGDLFSGVLGSAFGGAQQQYTAPPQYGRGRQAPPAQGSQWRDPGAASAGSLLEGLLGSFF